MGITRVTIRIRRAINLTIASPLPSKYTCHQREVHVYICTLFVCALANTPEHPGYNNPNNPPHITLNPKPETLNPKP